MSWKKFCWFMTIIACMLTGCADSCSVNQYSGKVKYEDADAQDVPFEEYDDEFEYKLPDGLTYRDKKYEHEYKGYLKKTCSDWEQRWNYHVWLCYYNPNETNACPNINQNDDGGQNNGIHEDNQHKTDAGIVDYNIFLPPHLINIW